MDKSQNFFQLRTNNRHLGKVLKKIIIKDEILDSEDLLTLYKAEGSDIFVMAHVADIIRKQQVGDEVSYVVNHNINFTNVCTRRCHFCAFSVPPNNKNGYLDISFDSWKEKLSHVNSLPITEVCIQGGINPEVSYDDYLKILDIISEINPSLHIHAFSPEEIKNAAMISGQTIEEVLKDFRNHGLGSIPGTAAEILDDNIRKIICPNKLTSQEWVDIIKLAHHIGIKSSSTIMFGHIENKEHWVKHLNILREIQDETASFTEFVPLPFISENTRLKKCWSDRIHKYTSLDIIKFYSAARLFLGTAIKNIQTSWVKLGIPLAQLTLAAGCNDFGGTLFEENITRAAGGSHGQFLLPNQIKGIINEINRPSYQRTTLYNRL